MRCALEELVAIENSTGCPVRSRSWADAFHVKPPAFSSWRLVSIERCGCVIDWFTHMILPWVTFAILYSAFYVRMIRSSVMETLRLKMEWLDELLFHVARQIA